MEKSLFIIRGIPGSGKTTLAEILAEGKYPVFSADQYFEKNGKYEWKKEELGIAHEICKRNVETNMKLGIEKIFVANTFTTEKEIAPYYDLAKNNGYKVFSIIVENRHNGINIHNVPNDSLNAMKARFSIKL